TLSGSSDQNRSCTALSTRPSGRTTEANIAKILGSLALIVSMSSAGVAQASEAPAVTATNAPVRPAASNADFSLSNIGPSLSYMAQPRLMTRFSHGKRVDGLTIVGTLGLARLP